MTRHKLLEQIKQRLTDAGVESAEYESRALLEWILEIDRSEYYMNPEKEVEKDKEERLAKICALREKRMPLQYIMEQTEFMGYSFYVNPHVLIPRQDTECLVELAVSRIGNLPERVLDLCCGSGCIGISVKKLCPASKVTLLDISEEALNVAAYNAKSLDANVEIIRSDLFKELHQEKYDYILSNPPYIKSQVIEELMPEVKEYEPRLALDGKEDGLYYYKKIIEQALEYLKNNGKLIFEIGADQGESVAYLMKQNGFTEVNVKQDLAGLDRIVLGIKSDQKQEER